jgi:4-diphosphocytidyl-2C-methyl-D-erythritol kinase
MVAAFTGSGPTCFGIYSTKAAAEIAVAKLTAAGHHAHLAEPVGAEFGMPARDEAGS